MTALEVLPPYFQFSTTPKSDDCNLIRFKIDQFEVNKVNASPYSFGWNKKWVGR